MRHAKAGSRGDWTGDDRKRPISPKGERQAARIVEQFQKVAVTAVYSSPYLRCVQTVEPLAKSRKLEVQQSADLAEGRGVTGLYVFFNNADLDDVVLCTHGDIVWELVEDLANRRVLPAFREQFEKGSTWVVDVEEGTPVSARYIAAP
ncbi:MAG TPA: phosphoglycerate mutase family protein [Candidatus Dormibacteraeota bacterium]|nr:phosphoglycerate mutase family protein [Candidatus Dormibacteraeota bacterium]